MWSEPPLKALKSGPALALGWVARQVNGLCRVGPKGLILICYAIVLEVNNISCTLRTLKQAFWMCPVFLCKPVLSLMGFQ